MKFDSDYTRAINDNDIQLERDDPEKRALAKNFLIRTGHTDLSEMIGVDHPIPNYGGKAA